MLADEIAVLLIGLVAELVLFHGTLKTVEGTTGLPLNLPEVKIIGCAYTTMNLYVAWLRRTLCRGLPYVAHDSMGPTRLKPVAK